MPGVPVGPLRKGTQTHHLANTPMPNRQPRQLPRHASRPRRVRVLVLHPVGGGRDHDNRPGASLHRPPLPQRVVPALFDVRRAPPPPLSCPDAAPTHRGGHNAALASTGAADPRFPSLPRHPGDATHLHSETSLMQACVRWTASLRATGPTSSAPLPPPLTMTRETHPLAPLPNAASSRRGHGGALREGTTACAPAPGRTCPHVPPPAPQCARPRIPGREQGTPGFRPAPNRPATCTAPDPAPGTRAAPDAAPRLALPRVVRRRPANAKGPPRGAALFSLDQAGLRLRRRPGPARRSAQRPRARAPPDRPEPCGPPRSRRRPAG